MLVDYPIEKMNLLGYLDDLVLIPLGVALAIKMIPPKVMEECRIQVEDVFKDGKPKNWIAGAIIVSIWVVIVCIVISEILRQYFINHPQSIDKYTFLQNSAFTHWVKEKCSKMC